MDVISAISMMAQNSQLNEFAARYTIDQIQKSNSIYILRGKAKIFHYRWKNGEIKIVPVWDDSLIIDIDGFWLNQYPFLRKVEIPRINIL